MNSAEKPSSVQSARFGSLANIVERNQVWDRMAAKYGVENPVPPWKTSLDGFCDALDQSGYQSGCSAEVLDPVDRRDEEDALSATVYAALPYPESRLVALAHSLLARGVIDESELQQRLTEVRARLEA
jgi:hypothetical protein